jgi:PTS system nitrogen regulatory IIA component
MRVSEFLAPANALFNVRASDKRVLLLELARKAASSLNLCADSVGSELLKREELGSTGLGNGVAIPHVLMEKVTTPFGVLAKLKQPIDFEAIDGRPVDLVCVLLLPTVTESGRLIALSLVARKLRTPEILTRLRNTKSSSELIAAIAD